MLKHLRAAQRRLLRTPALFACAVLCLGLGIGATTAMWTVVRAALLRPLPFEHPERLVAVHRITGESGPLGEKSQSAANYIDLARQSTQLQSLAAVTRGSAVVNIGSASLRPSEYLVTGNFFQTLGAHAALGRMIESRDDHAGAPRVVVVSHEFWQRELGGDAHVVGRALLVDGERTTVIGVLAPEFQVPIGSRVFRAEIWQPVLFTPRQLGNRDNYPLETLGRLAVGATVQSAEAELRGLYANLGKAFPELRGASLRVAPLQRENVQGLETPLALLFAAVCLVLAIAVSNVVALLFARAAQRRRELAVRAALGATVWNALTTTLAESALLVGGGLVLGIACALGGLRAFGTATARQVPQLNDVSIDASALVIAMIVAAITALVCGLLPALRAARVDPQDALRGGRSGGGGREQRRVMGILVIGELALSIVLLVGAGLLIRAFTRLLSSDPGFNPRNILTMNVGVVPSRYASDQMVQSFIEPALAAIRAVPGVEAAGVISSVPFIAWGNNSPTRYRSATESDEGRLPAAETRRVSPGFFDVTRQRLISGRFLQSTDNERAPVAFVVNEALAQRDFPGRSPVGAEMYSYTRGAFGTIVGVVSNVKNYGPLSEPVPETYVTLRQGGMGSGVPIMIRVRDDDPMRVAAGVRAAIATIDPEAAISDVLPMTDVIARSLGGPQFYAELLACFAAVAIVLAAAGLYGVLSSGVSQRTREIGVRSALGGSPVQIITLVVRDALTMAGVGLALGAIAALAATSAMGAMLHGVSPLDPVSWVATAIGLFAVVVIAAAVPARRASSVPPAIALTAE